MLPTNIQTNIFLILNNIYLEAYNNLNQIETPSADEFNLKIYAAALEGISLEYFTEIDYINVSTLVPNTDEFIIEIFKILLGKELITIDDIIDYTEYTDIEELLQNYSYNLEEISKDLTNFTNELLESEDTNVTPEAIIPNILELDGNNDILFNIVFDKVQIADETSLESIAELESLPNLTPDELRRIEGFKIKYSIVINDFDMGLNAINKLVEYKELYGGTNIDIHSIISEFISKFQDTAEFTFNNELIYGIYYNTKALLEDTPSEIFMSLNKLINDYMLNKLNQDELNQTLDKFKDTEFAELPQYKELENLKE